MIESNIAGSGADIDAANSEEIRKRLEQGLLGIPVQSWFKKPVKSDPVGYSTARANIWKAMKESSAKATETLRYPLIDLYAGNALGKEGKLEEASDFCKAMAVRPKVADIYKNPKEHDFYTLFPYVIGDRMVDIGLLQTRQEWLFTPKEDAKKPTKEERDYEKYYINAIIEFLRKGYQDTKFTDAEEHVRSVCEGRASPNVRSHLYLFKFAAPFFEDLKARKPAHPADVSAYVNLKTVEGRTGKILWQQYFNELVQIYNQSLYAKITGKQKYNATWGNKDKRGELQIAELGDTADNIGILGEQWIMLSLLSDHLKDYSEVKEIRTGRLVGKFQTVDDEISSMLDWLDDKEYENAVQELTRYIERFSRGTWTTKIAEKSTGRIRVIKKVLLAKTLKMTRQLKETQSNVYNLLNDLRVYREYTDEVFDKHDLAINAQEKIDLWDERLATTNINELNKQLKKLNLFVEDDPEKTVSIMQYDPKKYAQKLIHLVDAIFGPVDNMAISYALLTVLLRRYVMFFMVRLIFSCRMLLGKGKAADQIAERITKIIERSQEGEDDAGGEPDAQITDEADVTVKKTPQLIKLDATCSYCLIPHTFQLTRQAHWVAKTRLRLNCANNDCKKQFIYEITEDDIKRWDAEAAGGKPAKPLIQIKGVGTIPKEQLIMIAHTCPKCGEKFTWTLIRQPDWVKGRIIGLDCKNPNCELYQSGNQISYRITKKDVEEWDAIKSGGVQKIKIKCTTPGCYFEKITKSKKYKVGDELTFTCPTCKKKQTVKTLAG